MPHLQGLYLSSRARAWLDNLAPSRARGGVARTLSRAELERELNKLVAARGWGAINELRDAARLLAPALEADARFRELDDLIGGVQGTRQATTSPRPASRRVAGMAADAARITLFGTLHAALMVEQLPQRPEQPGSWPALSFFEAYFSNWIEGTEFELEEAEALVFEGEIPTDRDQDAHDVLGTFELVNTESYRRTIPSDADEFVELLRSHHATMLERRPAARPGAFKIRPNQAGSTTFVHPDLTEGTLREGFRYLDSLPDGLARAIFLMFLISEVHPFTDGNGRVARVLMNAALSAAGQQRIVVPLVYRNNYLESLRAMTHHGNPTPLIRVLDYAQRYASLVPWQELADATRVLRETNAFVAPDAAERDNVRLELPQPTEPGAARPLRPGSGGEPDLWVAQHSDLLKTIWERFQRDGEWPDARRLARERFNAGDGFDPEAFGRSIPPELGRFDVSSGRVALTPRGLSYLSGAAATLAHIPTLVAVAAHRYGDPGIEPLLSSSEFSDLLGVSPPEAQQISELLLQDGWLFRAHGSDAGGAQQFAIDSAAVLRIRDVVTVEDYFRARGSQV